MPNGKHIPLALCAFIQHKTTKHVALTVILLSQFLPYRTSHMAECSAAEPPLESFFLPWFVPPAVRPLPAVQSTLMSSVCYCRGLDTRFCEVCLSPCQRWGVHQRMDKRLITLTSFSPDYILRGVPHKSSSDRIDHILHPLE